MADGYVRQSETEIQDDEVILAADLNAEYDAIEAAFHQTTGHVHDGTTGGGAPISYTNLTNTPTLGNSSSLDVGTTSGTVAAGDDSRIVNAVPNTLTISAGTGLTGGGDLTTNRTISLDSSSIASLSLADTAVQPSDLGTIATQDASSVSITGGSITGITDLAVADGGTGASTALGARQNLGVAWELISSQEYTTTSAIDVTNLGNYRHLRFTMIGVVNTSGDNLNLRTSTDNGATFAAGASDYTYAFLNVNTTTSQAASNTASAIYLVTGLSNSYSFTVQGTIINLAQTSRSMNYVGINSQINSTPTQTFQAASGMQYSSTPRNAIRIFAGSGTFSCHMVLEGCR